MPLTPGRSLLHFRLVEKIGEGGMGEVWKAVDTTLDREVAIKVLPAAFSSDPERLLRLEREAKLLASLNHPNIAAIYGFPEAAGLRFLAMELVRGDDLAEILTRGPMPVREALEAARQVAAALEAAHDSGVIHRDLKPANVKRTPEGQIKVLDFGLAKATESASPNSGQSRTVTSAGSVAGMILGTASYMSPEQARGQPVDRRTDLWAFGCLLYEMLAGTKAFDGPTVTDVLAAVVTGEPDWSKLPATTPSAARRLLRRCLEKDVRKRLRDAGDASLLLDDNPEDARSGPVPILRDRPSRMPVVAAIALVAAMAGLAGGWFLPHRGGGDAAAEAKVTFSRITFSRGMLHSARFAPDGQTIVYGAAWDGPPVKLYLGRTESPEATPISVPPGELLAISKTGELAMALGLSYSGWMGDGTLARTSLLGGSPREIAEHVRSADWSPDGSEMAIVRRVDGLDQLEYPAGKVLYKCAGYIADVRISPDGQRVAFTDHPVYADDLGALSVVDRSGKKTDLRTGLTSVHGAVWTQGGKEIWSSGQDEGGGYSLFSCDLAGHSRTIFRSIAITELFDIAPDGRVLIGGQRNERFIQAHLAGDTGVRDVIIPGQPSMARALSNDGRTLLVTDQSIKDYAAFAVRSDRPGAVRLAVGDGMALSPDGAFALVVSADTTELSVSPIGMGEVRKIPNPGGIHCECPPGWLPDGKRVVFTGRKGNEDSRGYVCDIGSGALKAFGDPGVSWEFYGTPPVSPDGRMVILRDKSKSILRWPVDGGPPLPVPGLLPGDVPVAWSDDGAAIFVAGSAVPIPITRVELATGRRTLQTTISPSDAAGLRFVIATITPSGKYWALSVSKLLTELYVIEGLK